MDNSFSKTKNIELKSYINSFDFQNTDVAIRYLFEARPGSGAARNKGIKAARYDQLVFIDEDCIPHKDWLKKILIVTEYHKNEIIQGKNLNGIPGNIFSSLVHFTTESYFQSTHFLSDQNKVESNLLDTKNFAMKKSFFKRNLYFDTRFIHFEDVDFSLRVKQRGIKIIYIPDVIVWHCGRGDILSFIKREFVKGENYHRFQKKWQIQNKADEISRIMEKWQKQKTHKVELRLKREILKDKNIFFRFLFYLLLYADRLAIYSGYYFEKLSNRHDFYTKLEWKNHQ